jgi:hypothetical protein
MGVTAVEPESAIRNRACVVSAGTSTAALLDSTGIPIPVVFLLVLGLLSVVNILITSGCFTPEVIIAGTSSHAVISPLSQP